MRRIINTNNHRSPPHKGAATEWLWVGAWIFFIYASIPLARTIQEYIRDLGAKAVFLWITYLAFGLATIAVIRAVRRKQISLSPWQALILLLILGAFSWLTWSLRKNPEEALHFVQYGVLSLLIFRALLRHISDWSIYILAAMLGTFFGILDEIIQWLIPDRYFDYRDIGINALAVWLVQAALAMGIHPEPGRSPAVPASLGITLVVLALNLCLILFCLNITPQFIDLVRSNTTAPGWLKTPISEYGYLYSDPRIGTFKSRLPPDELARQDRERYAQVAATLDSSKQREQYLRFIRQTPAHVDPLAVESRVHLFRRDQYAKRAGKTENATIAWYENLIMEKYFPNVLSNSNYAWPSSARNRIEQKAELHANYHSRVSSRLIVFASQMTLSMALGCLILLSLFTALLIGRRPEPEQMSP